MRDTIKFLCGSVSVYLIVAACAGSGSKSKDSDDDSSNSGTAGNGMAMSGRGSGGNAGNASGGNVTDGAPFDAMMDAMMDPVPDADAQTPQENTVTCVLNGISMMATMNYPGATVRELSNTIVYGTLITPIGTHTHARGVSVLFGDGVVTADCGLASNPSYSAFTFIRP